MVADGVSTRRCAACWRRCSGAPVAGRWAALNRQSAAIAIDLESHLVADAAAAAGLPFAVLRAVADPAGRALPPAALIGLDAAGRPALGRILWSLMRQPAQLPALLQVARDTRRALAALRRAAEALGDDAER